MAIQVHGQGGVVADADGTGFRTLRATLRPLEYGALGAYAYANVVSPVTQGIAAKAEIFQFRWLETTRFACVHLVQVTGFSVSTSAFLAGFAMFDIILARGWSTVGGAGILAVNNNLTFGRLRTRMGRCNANEIALLTTAGALPGGVKTLDPNPAGVHSFSVSTATSQSYVQSATLFDARLRRGHPLVFVAHEGTSNTSAYMPVGEGVVVRATVPAGGTWQAGVQMHWTEVAEF
jgi:hypothetical protein